MTNVKVGWDIEEPAQQKRTGRNWQLFKCQHSDVVVGDLEMVATRVELRSTHLPIRLPVSAQLRLFKLGGAEIYETQFKPEGLLMPLGTTVVDGNLMLLWL